MNELRMSCNATYIYENKQMKFIKHNMITIIKIVSLHCSLYEIEIYLKLKILVQQLVLRSFVMQFANVEIEHLDNYTVSLTFKIYVCINSIFFSICLYYVIFILCQRFIASLPFYDKLKISKNDTNLLTYRL